MTWKLWLLARGRSEVRKEIKSRHDLLATSACCLCRARATPVPKGLFVIVHTWAEQHERHLNFHQKPFLHLAEIAILMPRRRYFGIQA